MKIEKWLGASVLRIAESLQERAPACHMRLSHAPLYMSFVMGEQS